MPTPNKEKWEEDLKKKLSAHFLPSQPAFNLYEYIRKLLASQKREIVEKLKGMRKEEEKLDGIDINSVEWGWVRGKEAGHNYLLNDIIKSLTEKGDE